MTEMHPLAGIVADLGDQIASTMDLDAQHAAAAVGVVERHALHQPGQHLPSPGSLRMTALTRRQASASGWIARRFRQGMGWQMTKDELQGWATANGWRVIAGHLSLTKPRAPAEPIVRLLLKATVATLEIRKPAGKWEKVASAAYAKVVPDSEGGPPGGLGFETVPSLSMLMQENRDQMVFARLGG